MSRIFRISWNKNTSKTFLYWQINQLILWLSLYVQHIGVRLWNTDLVHKCILNTKYGCTRMCIQSCLQTNVIKHLYLYFFVRKTNSVILRNNPEFNRICYTIKSYSNDQKTTTLMWLIKIPTIVITCTVVCMRPMLLLFIIMLLFEVPTRLSEVLFIIK